ncbi:MAG TPA: hypothetical protein VH141_27775 [Pseudonocardia sp.]|jgi:hypothetical protein|nr:hypothetical protein [Pseudonocardia sp.]
MCSSSSSWQPPPPPAIAGFAEPTLAPNVRPVWVLLEEFCRHDPAFARTVPDGVDLTGRAKGFLLEWVRSGRGDWLGVVHVEVRFVDGREATQWWNEQRVPGYALLPREERRPPRRPGMDPKRRS